MTDDLISRQAAIKAFYIQSDDAGWWVGTAQDAETLLNGLPSAEKVGKWIKLYAGNYKCSVCGDWWGNDNNEMVEDFKYCPNCGARMEGEEDETD